MEYRDVGVEVEKWRMVMFMKNAQCPSTMTTNLTLCDHIYPHMGTGLSHVVCSYCMGYLIDGDHSVMHEGMVRGPTP